MTLNQQTITGLEPADVVNKFVQCLGEFDHAPNCASVWAGFKMVAQFCFEELSSPLLPTHVLSLKGGFQNVLVTCVTNDSIYRFFGLITSRSRSLSMITLVIFWAAVNHWLVHEDYICYSASVYMYVWLFIPYWVFTLAWYKKKSM